MQVQKIGVNYYQRSKNSNNMKNCSFEGKFINNLPVQYLKEFDPFENLSAKKMKTVVNYVDFIKNKFTKIAKSAPEDDLYMLQLGHQGAIELLFKPNTTKEWSYLSSLNSQMVHLGKVNEVKKEAAALINKDSKIIEKIKGIVDPIQIKHVTHQKQMDSKYRKQHFH